jgi:hypothetical protein
MALNSAVLAAVVLAVLIYRYVLHPALFSPLAKIPAAHPTAAVSSFWFWWAARTDRQAGSLLAAHRSKGPVVRVEPNHVHVASQDGLRVIYHVGRFERDAWWLQFRPYNGTPNMLTFLDAKQHATRRRIVSLVYSKSYLIGSTDFQRLAHDMLFERLLPVFDEAAETGGSVDVYDLSLATATEFTSLYMFGTANGLDIVRKGRDRQRREYLAAGRDKILELKGAYKSATWLEDHTLDMLRAADDSLATAKARPNDPAAPSTYPVLYATLRDAIPKKEGSRTPQQTTRLVAAELIDNMEASRVGVGAALTFLLHELTRHPATAAALRAELATLDPPLAFPSAEKGVSAGVLRTLDALPLLGAVVTETLRLRNPIRMPFRRVAPPGGATIDGFFVPAGTTLSASTYTMHMNAEAFPEPEKWVPERWLNLPDGGDAGAGDEGEAEKGARAENDPRKWFWTFLSGSRMCIGNNYALLGKSLLVFVAGLTG